MYLFKSVRVRVKSSRFFNNSPYYGVDVLVFEPFGTKHLVRVIPAVQLDYIYRGISYSSSMGLVIFGNTL